MKPSQADLEAKGREALELQKELTEKTTKLDVLKEFFRNYILKHNDKKGLTLPITGLGVVAVSAPSAAKPAGTTMVPDQYTFNLPAFQALPAAQQKKLIEQGVVTFKQGGLVPVAAKPDGTPAIKLTVV